MGGVVIDGVDKREGREMVVFIIELDSLFCGRRSVGYSHRILNKPFIDCFCSMSHEDSTTKVGFGKDVWKGRGMIEMETV